MNQVAVTAPAVASAPARQVSRWGFLEWFIISQTALPALLYLPGTQSLRVPIRVAAYTVSLTALLWWMTQQRMTSSPHPSRPWLLGALAYLGLQLFHPATNSVAAGIAQIGLYLAVMAPVFWAPGLVRGEGQLRRLLAILLICNGVNALVGVLQVYDPGRWMPSELSIVVAHGYDGQGVTAMSYVGPDGRRIIRPPGLSDAPGAVCGPAATVALLGLFFCADKSVGASKRAGSIALAFVGLTAIYLSQVRTSLVIVVGSTVVYVIILCIQRERKRATFLLVLGAILILSAMSFAALLGGRATVDRFSTLLADDPQTIYYQSRGRQVDASVHEFISKYPIGAGLGRWGMMRLYFGDESNTSSPSIWAEIQLPAWLLDGGIVLVALYGGALLRATWCEFRLAQGSVDRGLRNSAAVILAANAGTLALVFSFIPFAAPIGQQYWFLAGVLHGASAAWRRSRPPPDRADSR